MSQPVQFGSHPDADQLSAFAENALPPHERESVLTHLTLCADCRETVALSLPPLEAAPLAPERKRWFTGLNLLWPAAALAVTALIVAYAHRVAIAPNVPGGPEQVAQIHPPAPPQPLPANAPPSTAPPTSPAKPSIVNPHATPLANQPVLPAEPLAAQNAPLTGRFAVPAARTAAALPAPSAAEGTAIAGLPTKPEGGAMQFHGAASAVSGGLAAGIGAGMPPQPAPPAPAILSESNATSDAITVNAAAEQSSSLTDTTSDAAAAQSTIAPILPSGAAVLSTVVRGRQILAVDVKNAVFLSNDDGVHWAAVNVPWKGHAVRAELVSASLPPRPLARAQKQSAGDRVFTGTAVMSAEQSSAAQTPAMQGAAMNGLAPAPATAALAPPPPGLLGSLSGIVTDAAGAVVRDTSISVTGTDGEVLKTARTGPDGRYLIDGLPPGTYSLSAVASGFQIATLHDIPLGGATPAVRDLKLQVGAATETVTVTSAPPAIPLEQARTTALKARSTANSGPDLFAITTDSGERWTSADGLSWRRQESR